MSIITKFRAFQLDSEGSLFSFYKKNHYTLIEARLPKGGIAVLGQDLAHHEKQQIDTLHITSWDADHCNYDDLIAILNNFRPSIIEIPDYLPDSDQGQLCRRVVFGYDRIHEQYVPNVRPISLEYIRSLQSAEPLGTSNIIYRSAYDCENKNDMSLIKLFRSAGFNVLSLGDCESEEIASRLLTYTCIGNEVDILILPHHGANNGFTTGALLDYIMPRLAICSSNYDNQYDHPRPEICSLLSDRDIPLLTTKTGDAIVLQKADESVAQSFNFRSNNKSMDIPLRFTPKKFQTAVYA
jgi:competence protein ComEC